MNWIPIATYYDEGKRDWVRVLNPVIVLNGCIDNTFILCYINKRGDFINLPVLKFTSMVHYKIK